MINTSIIDILKYVSSVLKDNGISKVYEMNLPKKLAEKEKVFALVDTSQIYTKGQFQFQAYGQVFVNVDIFIKALSDMELDSKTFKQYEKKMRNLIISNQFSNGKPYSISDSKIGGSYTDENRGYHILQTTLQITII